MSAAEPVVLFWQPKSDLSLEIGAIIVGDKGISLGLGFSDAIGKVCAIIDEGHDVEKIEMYFGGTPGGGEDVYATPRMKTVLREIAQRRKPALNA